ncbi:DNA-binding response regulator [Actinomadura sp. NBRC 104412]|uniref:response regulator transcription factor n=1 Tax=Actinomadura sp. NBRC 104412 TaxID=3032203 RepID=UPI0024A2B305|nr:response regulator transcription factor [Actinomadura sp. NBRC 104412]GLZ07536.1 DNA-binding response regulator [Actinomadura sp. NBRC 104412]
MNDSATVTQGAGARLLVVDDDPHINELLVTTLRFAGYEVASAASGTEALRAATDFSPAVAILDVMLPDIDGFEVVRRLRRRGHTFAVLLLTARDGTEDKITGLALGGDDYVTKPFSIGEVIARLQALLRRVQGGADRAVLRYADLEMDEAGHQVRRAGQAVELSPTEYRLLRYLLLNAGRVVSKAQILDQVWQYDFGGDAGVVEKFMSNLRRKIDADRRPLLHTIRGFGYVLKLPAS